jgi:hypothetical protein
VRNFIALGGGVGLGTLGVTHGLGPEPAAPPPPPPPPTATSGPADEREAIWERKRQVLRDCDAQQAYWRSQQTIAEQYARARAEIEAAGARAAAEQQRLRASDLLHRFQPVEGPPEWLPPNRQQRWSTSGAAPYGVAPVHTVPIEQGIERVEVVDGTEVEPASPLADYAILPLGDHATIEALADGTLEVFVDPVTGIRAVLETEDGRKFIYGRVGSVAKRRVKAGETIGFTPYARKPQPPMASDTEPPMPPMAGGKPPAGELPPKPVPRWPSEKSRRQPVSARAGGGAPPDNVVPLRRPPPGPPPADNKKGVGVLLLLGLGVALLAGGKRRR